MKTYPRKSLGLRNFYILCIATLFVVFTGCLNRYERDIIGSYKVSQYKLLDSTKTLNFNLPNLIIGKDKSFLLSFDDKKFMGKWEADDYGDWTLATFYMNGSEAQAMVGIESLIINNPWQFHCPFLKTMEFQKIKVSKPNLKQRSTTSVL